MVRRIKFRDLKFQEFQENEFNTIYENGGRQNQPNREQEDYRDRLNNLFVSQ